MTKREIRKELEALSIDLWGNKYTYQKIQRKGLSYKHQSGYRSLLYLDDNGIREYMLQTKKKQNEMINEFEQKYKNEIEKLKMEDK
jgi:hypothetical protein